MIAGDCGNARTALPSPTAMLRNQRSWPMRRIGLPSRRRLNSSSSHMNSSTSVALSSPLRTSKSGNSERCANLFQGQTTWQSSQPYTRLPISGRNSTGMLPFNSMVR
ncbi:hypothetical protein D9M68_973810 [compost metagenome]